jgi:hypothetical protein
LDAWVLRSTWSPLTTIGYEVKVSRSDFEQDQKWLDYRPLVHRLYMVCPPKLVLRQDLPEGIGLIWATVNGKKLVTKVKAAYQEPDFEQVAYLMAYVLMWRASVKRCESGPLPDRRERSHVERLRAQVEAAEERRELASLVNQNVRGRMRAMQNRLRAAEARGKRANQLVKDLADRGITWDPDQGFDLGVLREMDRLRGAVNRGVLNRMRRMADDLKQTALFIEGQVDE